MGHMKLFNFVFESVLAVIVILIPGLIINQYFGEGAVTCYIIAIVFFSVMRFIALPFEY